MNVTCCLGDVQGSKLARNAEKLTEKLKSNERRKRKRF